MKFSTMEELDRRAVTHLIRSIRILSKEDIHIDFNFQNEYQKAVALAKQISETQAAPERMVS